MVGRFLGRKGWAVVALPFLLLSVRAQFQWQLQSGTTIGLSFSPAGFVAITGGGYSGSGIICSRDGKQWRSPYAPPRSAKTIAAGNGNHVLTADSSIWLSRDGVYWTGTPNPSDEPEYRYQSCRLLSFLESHFIMQGPDNQLWKSSDATNWVSLGKPPGHLHSIAFGDGKFVASSYYISGDFSLINQLLFSTNLTTWTVSDPPTKIDAGAIAFGNSLFVALKNPAGIISSTNGEAWTESPQFSTGQLRDIIFADGKFLLCGANGLIASSTNGSSWEIQRSPTSAPLYKIGYANGAWVIGGSGGEMLYSTNARDWKLTRRFPSSDIKDVTVIDGRVLGVSSSSLWQSSNLEYWNAVSVPGASRLSRIAYGLGRYVLTGSDGSVFVSSNLSDWASSQMPTTNSISDVCYGDQLFVAVGTQSTVLTSKDGLSWRLRTQGTLDLRGVAYGNGAYVAIGLGRIISSPDAINWTIRSQGNVELNSVAFGKGAFVVAGSRRGTILTSTNGIDWSYQTRGSIFHTIAFTGHDFLIAGDSGSLLVSTDGFNWTPCPSSPYARLFGYHSQLYFGFTPNPGPPDFFTSAPALRMLPPRRIEPGYLNIPILGTGTNQVVAESSSDLKNWRPIANIQGQEADLSLSIAAPEVEEPQFIRLKYNNDGGNL